MILVPLMRALQITVLVLGVAAAAGAWRAEAFGEGGQGRGRGASPASVRPTPAAAPQGFSREQIDNGRTRFAAQCGFCHGRDAAGGEGGTDLTRSALVGTDVGGDKIRPLLRSGRPDKGMPAFTLADADVTAIVAFIHDQREQAASATGNRRTVDAADLQTGNADAGRSYFNASCANCHAPGGDLAGIANRLQGLALLQRMLYPAPAGGAPSRAKVTVTTAAGTVAGTLAYRDEFTIALTDSTGSYRAFPVQQVKFTVDDPLQAHIEQLRKYTDDDMHNVFAYLQTLR